MENETVEEKLERVMAERDFALDVLCDLARSAVSGKPPWPITAGERAALRVYVFAGRDLAAATEQLP